jgi:outer membrane protein TolC
MNKTLLILALRVLFLIFFLSNNVMSQTVQNIDLESDTLVIDQNIPGVDSFIQSALVNSPLLRISDTEVQEIFEKIKIEKKSWSDYVFIEGDARYGLYNQIIANQLTGTTAIDYGLKVANKQLTYYGGLTLKIPISKVLNRKSQIDLLNFNLTESKLRKEQVERELTSIVIEDYYKLIKSYQILQVNQNVLQTLRITHLKVQKDLSNGLIELDDYSNFLISKGKAEEGYYNARNDYYTQYKKIQVLTGLYLNSSK